MPFRSTAPKPGAYLAFICLSLSLDSLAQSISFPFLPRLAQSLVGGDPVAGAGWVGWLEVGWALPQLLAAPLLGALSDRYGRRPVIVASLFGVSVELLLNALAPDIGWLLVGRMLCGMTCGAQAASFAYVADVTDSVERAQAYALAGAALWAGVIVGPAIGGLLAQVDLRTPFWAAAVVALLAAAYGVIALPESLALPSRAPLRWRSATPLGAMRLVFGTPSLACLGGAFLLSALAFQGKDNMLALYTAYRYHWTSLDLGLFVTVLASGGLVVQAYLARRVVAAMGETSAVLAGLCLQALGMAVMGAASTGEAFGLANVPAVLGALADPALRALMSQGAPASEQGRLQGGLATITSASGVIAPVAFTQIFAWSIGQHGARWAGLTLFIGAILSTLALGFVILEKHRRGGWGRRLRPRHPIQPQGSRPKLHNDR